MKIEVKQIKNGSFNNTNEFEIKINNKLKYTAKLPHDIYLDINTGIPLIPAPKVKLESNKIEDIELFDLDGNIKYNTVSIDNEMTFESDTDKINFYSEKIVKNNYKTVLDINSKKYYIYKVEDGYLCHMPIYEGDIQIGEAIKINARQNENDIYYAFIKDDYEFISDGIILFLLKLDKKRDSHVNSRNMSLLYYDTQKKYTIDENNKYYDKNWIKYNVDKNDLIEIEDYINKTKERLSGSFKLILIIIGIALGIGLIITIIILIICAIINIYYS